MFLRDLAILAAPCLAGLPTVSGSVQRDLLLAVSESTLFDLL